MTKRNDYGLAAVVNLTKEASEDGLPTAMILCVEGCCVEGGLSYQSLSFTMRTTLLFHPLLLMQVFAGQVSTYSTYLRHTPGASL